MIIFVDFLPNASGLVWAKKLCKWAEKAFVSSTLVFHDLFELCRRYQQPSLTFCLVGGIMFGSWPLFHLRDGGKPPHSMGNFKRLISSLHHYKNYACFYQVRQGRTWSRSYKSPFSSLSSPPTRFRIFTNFLTTIIFANFIATF
jgi:hypothetical protein